MIWKKAMLWHDGGFCKPGVLKQQQTEPKLGPDPPAHSVIEATTI